jgi:hypothetical protein
VKLGGHLGTGVVRDWRRTRLHDTFLAKHGQHPIQRFRVAPTNALLSTPKTQKSIHDLVVQSLNRDVFVLQPPAQICDCDNLSPDRVMSIALFSSSDRVGVEVYVQRTLAKPFNGACESEKLVYHPSRVSGACQNYAAASSLKCP